MLWNYQLFLSSFHSLHLLFQITQDYWVLVYCVFGVWWTCSPNSTLPCANRCSTGQGSSYQRVSNSWHWATHKQERTLQLHSVITKVTILRQAYNSVKKIHYLFHFCSPTRWSPGQWFSSQDISWPPVSLARSGHLIWSGNARGHFSMTIFFTVLDWPGRWSRYRDIMLQVALVIWYRWLHKVSLIQIRPPPMTRLSIVNSNWSAQTCFS